MWDFLRRLMKRISETASGVLVEKDLTETGSQGFG